MCNSRMANLNFECISAAFAFSVSSYNPNLWNINFLGLSLFFELPVYTWFIGLGTFT